mmetsp:Transcript_37802/g.100439  ORF Transcript_37802/g.100439 Transcript_37802/m.100439 type:complete len:358 (-) Transcript_37802:868-1941(-)
MTTSSRSYWLSCGKVVVFAVAVQETWRKGQLSVENHGFVMLCNGVTSGACRGGVSIVMSPQAVEAWIAAGSSVMYFGPRIIAVKFKLLDCKNRKMAVRFVSAYAPVSTSGQKVRNEYLDELQKCIISCSDEEVLIIGTDANASMGTRTSATDHVLGPYGISKQNVAGHLFRDFCETMNLCSAATFFTKRSYTTWRHMRSKFHYQLDHFLVRRMHLNRVVDACVYGALVLDSDHTPIRMKLRVARNLKHKAGRPATLRVNRGLLKCPTAQSNFLDAVEKADPSLSLPERVRCAAKATLSASYRAQPGWFQQCEADLLKLIAARNAAARNFRGLNCCEEKNRGSTASIKKGKSKGCTHC